MTTTTTTTTMWSVLVQLVVVLICILVTLVSIAQGFNLESRVPVVKRGSGGSYFGFSVAEHKERLGNSNDFVSWMLVGAPLDQNAQPRTNRSGALWKCPITTDTRDCIQVVTDGRRNVNDNEDDLQPPTDKEVKDGQWLGVTVRSAGAEGKIMVCAHRHIVKSRDSQWGQGQCYILTQNFKFEELKRPCAGKPTVRAHEQYGYCQAGTSGVLTPGNDYVVIGTPGPYTWRGTLYVSSVSDDFINKDTVVYSSDLQDKSPVSKYSYLGMSVTVGDFFESGLGYAAGAPRSNGTGQVVLFRRKGGYPIMDVMLILNGEQFASSFGYEIAAADVNGDKKSDLIVAAPFYYGKKEGGAVYVYTTLCKNQKESSEKCKPVKLVGKEESRFGFALTNLKDLNNDGYEDIAVGAPYEGMGTVYIYLGSKNGLITTPSQIIHSENTPMPLKTFGYSLSGGIDMDQNGYPDLLVGAYEEDAVALLRARRIINIVTSVRFVRKDGTLGEKMEPIDPNKQSCYHSPKSNYTCFSFQACCEIEAHVKQDHFRSLKLTSYIEAETYTGSKKFSRVWFGTSNNRPHYVSRIATLNSKTPQYCQTETVYLKENTRDIQSPIKFRLNYTLIQDEPVMPPEGAPLTDINNYPILNQQESARIFDASFQKDCGNNDICESDLRLSANLNLEASSTPGYFELLLGDKDELIVDVNVTNVGESAYEAQLFLLHSPSLSYIGTKRNDSANCDLHNTTLISCAIGNPFKKDKSVNMQVRFDPKFLDDSETKIGFIVFVNSTSRDSVKTPIRLQAIVQKRAELSIKGDAKSAWKSYGGPILGESAHKKLTDVGPKVTHTYQVFNDGPWKVSTMDVIISWPFQVASEKSVGKWLLYLEETPIIKGPGDNVIGECNVPPGRVNPLNLQASIGMEDIDLPPHPSRPTESYEHNQTSHYRRRRDIDPVISTKITIDKKGKRLSVVTMNPKTNSAKYFLITCTIPNLQKKEEAKIVVKARLWNSTLAEDYPNVDKVLIISNAKIVIPSNIIVQQNNLTDDEADAITEAIPDRLDQQEAEPVPLWIIIVAVVAGLLLLILLTLILWKIGFFKRRRPDHTLSGNLQKHNKDDNPESDPLVKPSTNLH